MTELQKLRQDADRELEELEEKRGRISALKSEVTILTMGVLLVEIKEALSEFLEVSFKKEYFDKDLCETIKTTIAEAINAFSKITPPTINVAAPQINLQPIVTEIKAQNEYISGLIEKMGSGNHSEEIYRLYVALVGKQNAFLEKSFEQIDIRPELKSVNDTLNNNRPEKLIVNRDINFRISEVVPIYKSK